MARSTTAMGTATASATRERSVEPGRRTAAYEGELVVFLIGMRVNRLRSFREWLPVARAMPPMLGRLAADQESGLLGFRTLVGWREVTVVQYWRDAASLERFANDPGDLHRPAWRAFFHSAFRSGSTGIWHETYVVPAGRHESVYVNMPTTGLGALAGTAAVGRRGEAFKERLPDAPAA